MKYLPKFMIWATVLAFWSFCHPANGQDIRSWHIQDIQAQYNGPPNSQTYIVGGPEIRQLDGRGAELLFYITPKSHPGCKQTFRIGWTFDSDIQTVSEGQSVSVQVFNDISGSDFLPCYKEGKAWAYDGGYLTVHFLGGSANHLTWNLEPFKKYWGPESPYLFALQDGKSVEVYPVNPGYPTHVHTGLGGFTVRDGIHEPGKANVKASNLTVVISKGGLFTFTVMYAYEAGPGAVATSSLGSQWLVGESGWLGIWTRKGTTNVFEATWVAGSARIRAELTMEVRGNQVIISRRNSSDGNDCTYTGEFSPDGKTVYGSYSCTNYPGPYPWSAWIIRDTSPPIWVD